MENYTIDKVMELANDLKFKSFEESITNNLELSVKEGWTTETLLYKIFNNEIIRKEKAHKKT